MQYFACTMIEIGKGVIGRLMIHPRIIIKVLVLTQRFRKKYTMYVKKIMYIIKQPLLQRNSILIE